MNYAGTSRSRGVALLFMLVGITVLSLGVLALLAYVPAATTGTQRYATRTDLRLLAASVADLAIARLREAIPKQPDRAWSSQPGLIRVYDATGQVNAFKLYSAAESVVTGDYDVEEQLPSEVPEEWDSMPALFTDLNAATGIGASRRNPILDASAPGSVPGLETDGARGVAMPVRWLYVLADGSLVPAAAGGGGRVASVAGASVANPIVARVAWWADDATCRVNVNTAAGGEPWVTPRTASTADRARGRGQPRYGEYQRYPGHPAVTRLEAVFPTLGPADRETLYGLLPFVAPGGSQGGEVAVGEAGTLDTSLIYAAAPYESPGELGRAAEDAGLDLDTERAGFCLTARSRAPETTLWGTPRVMLWPVHAQAGQRNGTEKLVAYAGTLPGNSLERLYVSREDADSTTHDMQIAGGPGPGGGAPNVALVNYLRDLTRRPVPGLGGRRLEDKYGAAERDAILAGMVDLIRCVNLTGANNPNVGSFTAPGSPSELGRGMVLPLLVASATGAHRGQGRWPLVSEVALDFSAAAVDAAGRATNMNALLLLELASPGQGYDFLRPELQIAVTNVVDFRIDGTHSIHFANVFTNAPVPPHAMPLRLGGPMGVAPLLAGRDANPTGAGGAWPFLVTGIPVSMAGFELSGGRLEITILSRNQVIQSLIVEFPPSPDPSISPPAKLPVPTMPPGNAAKYPGAFGDWWQPDFFSGDTVRTMELQDDWRLAAAQNILTNQYLPGGGLVAYQSSDRTVGSLHRGDGTFYDGFTGGRLVRDIDVADTVRPDLPSTVNGVVMRSGLPGDWDTGVGTAPDGAYHGKPDDGTVRHRSGANPTDPYFHDAEGDSPDFAVFEIPSRAMPSAVAFGSLPAGVVRDRPWETLLFCPNPAAGSAHPGFASPPDLVWLDFFHQPALEPRQVGDAFATEGQVNLNCQIAPFSYLRRETALRAALAPVRITAIPDDAGQAYKSPGAAADYSHALDLDATLAQVRDRFDHGGAFVSAGEICRLFLVPEGAGAASAMPGWWARHRLTGDNLREAPYAELLPRLTTRSDTYLVYYCVQRLQSSSDDGTWNEDTGAVLGEARGVIGVERRLEADDSRLARWDVIGRRLDPLYNWVLFGAREF